MTEPWYQVMDASQPLSQGDLILDCPVLVWKRLDQTMPTPLTERAAILSEDVIVMTQACDLEHRKVHDVVLCRHIPIEKMIGSRGWQPAGRRLPRKRGVASARTSPLVTCGTQLS
jgi:hypothetical protein